jgi:hypothetical protein
MPNRFAQFRELPDSIQKVSALAVAALFISVIALVVAVGKHAS